MNYTSIEQSKKLVKLGLNPKSADMCYIREQWWDNKANKMKECWTEFPVVDTDNSEDVLHPVVFPCWSLGALLELMPLSCLDNCGENKWRITLYVNDITRQHTIFANTPLKAAYNMVVWLLENGYIKTK